MPGEITRVDGKDGWVHVKTSEGTLIVHFPPSELANVKKGNKITLHLALKDMGPAPDKAPATEEVREAARPADRRLPPGTTAGRPRACSRPPGPR